MHYWYKQKDSYFKYIKLIIYYQSVIIIKQNIFLNDINNSNNSNNIYIGIEDINIYYVDNSDIEIIGTKYSNQLAISC